MNKLIGFSVLAVAFCLSPQNHPLLSQAPKDAKMECKLIVQMKSVAVGETPQAEVEIKNTAKKELIITFNTSPWEFLDIEVAGPAGKKISHGKYGGLFSPFSPTPQKKLILQPGETYRQTVGVFATTKDCDLTTPGVYRITAVFEYEKEKAVAKTIELTIKAK